MAYTAVQWCDPVSEINLCVVIAPEIRSLAACDLPIRQCRRPEAELIPNPPARYYGAPLRTRMKRFSGDLVSSRLFSGDLVITT